MLLMYKLNNVCGADHRPANGAQRTMIILIYHNILWLSMHIILYIDYCAKSEYALPPYYMRITEIMRIVCIYSCF